MVDKNPPDPSVEFQKMYIPGLVLQVLPIAYYILVLKAVRKIYLTDKLSSPFYHIFFVIGLVDVLHSLCLIWMGFEDLCIHGPFLTELTEFCSFMTCFGYLVNIMGNGLMALNRYSATFPTYHNHFSKTRRHIYLSVIFGVSAICSIPAFFRKRNYKFEDGEWKVTFGPSIFIWVQRLIIIIFLTVYLIVTAVSTILAYRRIQKTRISLERHKCERSLLKMVLAHFFLHIWVLFYEIFELTHFENVILDFAHQYFFAVYFGLIVVNPFLITLTTYRVRKTVSSNFCGSQPFLTHTARVSSIHLPHNPSQQRIISVAARS